MLAYQQGDNAAFNELYERYSGRVYAYLGNRVFNRNERDDLFQAVFLKLHKSRHLFNSTFQFAPWLFTICRTTLLDFLKMRKAEVISAAPITDQIVGEVSPDSALSLSQAGLELSDQQRAALEMRYRDGLDFSKIADRLKISSSNVRQVISRAVRKLRGKLLAGITRAIEFGSRSSRSLSIRIPQAFRESWATGFALLSAAN